MTISSETRKAGPFNGNGVTTSFPFVFKTFAKSDVKVIFTDADEIETILVLDSDYTVTLNVDPNANPGGSISYSTLATGEKLTVLGAVEYTQETDVQNQGGFYPEVIENAFDKITMLVQQVKEIADRAVVVPASSSVTSENYLDTINTYKVEAAASASAASTSASNADASEASALHWAAKAEAFGGDKLPIAGGSLAGLLNQAVGSDIPSASTVNLTAATGNTVRITGTTAITAFTMNAGQQMELVAVGALPLTYNATTMNINGNINYTCSAGDRLSVAKDGAGVVRVNVTKQDGSPISGSSSSKGYFYKIDSQSVAFTKTGAGTLSIKAGTEIDVVNTLQSYATDTSIVMPTLTAGTDYAIYVCTDGTVRADTSFTAPSGYTVGNSRQIGGFHYAPGGNAAAQSGGDTTPAINAYSLWDIKFRPACSDPRGMALVAGHFWADIYLLGVDYLTNGSSKYNVSIADGSAPPKRSTLYGGNGTTTYADGNWWNLNEALKHVGKRSPTYSEFAALAYGTTEATSSGGTDVPTTGVSGTGATSAWNLFTSKFGIIQASGCMWIWGDEFGGGAAAASYVANTQGRGSTYQMENAVFLGGAWLEAALSGSRASIWNFSPTASLTYIGARGVTDHLCIP